MKKKLKVAVGLSGGVDSTVAAYLLREQGYDVVGVTLKFQPGENRCCDLDSITQARHLCYKLALPYYVFDVEEEFRREVIDYFIHSYLTGNTPNPCAVCNRQIRFGWFIEKVKSFGIDLLATGHYARIVDIGNKLYLSRGKDKKKSQEYFLGMIDPKILDRLIFPLGEMTKNEVKRLAEQAGLMFIPRPESQDVCFAEGRGYAEFLEKRLAGSEPRTGPIKDLRGNILGEHRGIHRFTYGQRRGLGVTSARPLYVVDIDSKTNTVVLGEKKDTLKNSFFVSSLNWFYTPGDYRNIAVKVRRESPPLPCSLVRDDKRTVCRLEKEVSAPTPGQLAVFYDGDNVIAGGWIEKSEPILSGERDKVGEHQSGAHSLSRIGAVPRSHNL